MKKMREKWRAFWAPREGMTPGEAAEEALRVFPKCC